MHLLHSAFLFWQAPQKAWSNSWGNQWKFDLSHRKPWREFQEIKCGARHSKIAFLICVTDLSNGLQMQSDYPKWRYFMGKAWNLEQNKAVNLLGSTSVSWVMTRILDSALTCVWISFTGANMEWDKKGTRLESQPTTYPCEIFGNSKENNDLGADLSGLSASSYHCGRLSMRSPSHRERNEPTA